MASDKEIKFKFDKFMKNIVEREETGRQRVEDHLDGQDELPQRKYNRLYREHWQNSTRFRRKK
tara:strand:+ start:2407 stop:2595 length:189 start_codon:yes stop_codon:yes gene_type:complete